MDWRVVISIRPELTAEKFVPNPFASEPGARMYRTGDLVRYLPDGRLEFTGRSDQQVKIRGFRIELGEIEALLSQQDGVNMTAVMVHSEANGDKRLVAYVTAQTGASVEFRRAAAQVERTIAGLHGACNFRHAGPDATDAKRQNQPS